MRKLITLIFAIIVSITTYAQDTMVFRQYFKNNMYWFPENVNIARSEVFSTYKSDWGLTSADNMVLLSEQHLSGTDAYLDRYAQYNNGFLIENTIVNVVSKDGRVCTVSGFFIPHFAPNITNPTSESSALTSALTAINAPKYAWEDAALEEEIKVVTSYRKINDTTTVVDTTIDSTRTYFPTGTLVFAIPFEDTAVHDSSKYRLCWKFAINPMQLDTFVTDTNTIDTAPHYMTVVQYRARGEIYAYVNTLNATVYGIDPNEYGSMHTGHINATINDGNQTVNVEDQGILYFITHPYRYYFLDGDRLVELMASSTFGTGTQQGSNSDHWGGATGVDAYWQIEKAWDYYRHILGLEGTESGVEHHERIWLNQSVSSTHPSRTYYKYDHHWGDCYMIASDVTLPDGSTRRAAFLDVMGHEYTHAVIFHKINVHPTGEAGAIIEAFCDFFGYRVAQNATGGYADLWAPDPGLARGFGHRTGIFSRHFPTPGNDYPSPSPAKYLETGVWDGSNVYNMSGVLRHVFYLLHDHDSYSGVSVPNVPNVVNNFDRDMYNIMIQLSASDDYSSFSDRFIGYYMSTYGHCSDEAKAAYLAWKAVGIDHGNPCCPYQITTMGHITGNATWTPTNNPVTGPTSSPMYTMTIGTDIIIDPGATLTISGMTIRMGNGKYIKVSPAATSGGTGGKLVLDHATLTHNSTGCDASNSRWGGIRVCGDPSYPQGSLSGSAQGVVNMSYSTVSYAVTGVQTAFSSNSDAGGIINAYYCNFENNGCHANIFPYHNMAGSTESDGTYNFRYCNFTCDNSVPVQPSAFITATTIKGLKLTNCLIKNNTGSAVTAGILTSEAMMTVSNCTIENFDRGTFDLSWSGSRSIRIQNSTFNGNKVGAYVNGGITPYIISCTFNIPSAGSVPLPSPLSGTTVYPIDGQMVGVVVAGTSTHYISGNTFKTNAPGMPGYYPLTTGVIAHSNGAADNKISGNTFTGVGVAMSSNFINNNASGSSGLRFLCNKDSKTGYDIVIAGSNTINGGICAVQAYDASGYHGAGNVFGNTWHIYNQQKPIDYYYNSAVAAQRPTNNYGLVTTHATGEGCGVIIIGDEMSLPYTFSVLGNASENKILRRSIAVANLGYYLAMDTTGRDSAYYWAGQMGDAYGDLVIAGMKIDDGATEEALTIYDGIIANYQMDDDEMNEFVMGRTLMNMLIDKRNGDQNMAALDSVQVDSLVYIAEHTSTWAHARAESWLHLYDGRDLNNTLLYPGDDPENTVLGNPGVLAVTEISNGPSGHCEYVEMIAANCGETTGELVNISGWTVDDNAGNFNTSGLADNISTTAGHYRFAYAPIWQNVPVGSIIVMYNHDDNCYNLPETVEMTTNEEGARVYWVPVGGDSEDPYENPFINRYTTTPTETSGNYCYDESEIVFDGLSNNPTPPLTSFETASDWVNTIGLRNGGDAIQVRCPGCDTAHTDTVAFYHGIGYGPDAGTYAFASIPVGTLDLGGPVKVGCGTGKKFVYTGTEIASLGDDFAWAVDSVDTAGIIPPTLGRVTPELQDKVNATALEAQMGTGSGGGILVGGIGGQGPTPTGHAAFPCCAVPDVRGGGHGGYGGLRKAQTQTTPAVQDPQKTSVISVHPNPANDKLYFEFPLSAKTTVRIIDMSGRTLSEQVVTDATKATIELRGYTSGMYMFQVITDGKTKSGKFVIEK